MVAFDLAPHQLQLFDPAYPRFDAQRPLLVLAAQFAWLLPALAPEQDFRGLAGIRGVVERLFSHDGCPWDQAQTPQTLATHFIVEACELVDAIESGNPDEIREELGDILAHVFMQTSVAQQAGDFTVEDVVEYISRKLVRRHPHVYGDADTDSPEEIERIWEQIKATERAERDARNPDAAQPESALDSVPNSAPSLVRTDQLIGRAERAGLTPPPQSPRSEVATALNHAPDGRADDAAIGALLWATVRLARESEVNAEQALRLTANDFTDRFRTAESQARSADLSLPELPSDRHQATWPSSAQPRR